MCLSNRLTLHRKFDYPIVECLKLDSGILVFIDSQGFLLLCDENIDLLLKLKLYNGWSRGISKNEEFSVYSIDANSTLINCDIEKQKLMLRKHRSGIDHNIKPNEILTVSRKQLLVSRDNAQLELIDLRQRPINNQIIYKSEFIINNLQVSNENDFHIIASSEDSKLLKVDLKNQRLIKETFTLNEIVNNVVQIHDHTIVASNQGYLWYFDTKGLNFENKWKIASNIDCIGITNATNLLVCTDSNQYISADALLKKTTVSFKHGLKSDIVSNIIFDEDNNLIIPHKVSNELDYIKDEAFFKDIEELPEVTKNKIDNFYDEMF
ncbi:MAG: hypothetical protein MHMPM18_000390 [Marteilia pararefringens]